MRSIVKANIITSKIILAYAMLGFGCKCIYQLAGESIVIGKQNQDLTGIKSFVPFFIENSLDLCASPLNVI
jgi:hypothetical protein